MNFYKTVVKAVNHLVDEQGIKAYDIKYNRKYDAEKIDKELAELNDKYLTRIRAMLRSAADIANDAKNDMWLD